MRRESHPAAGRSWPACGHDGIRLECTADPSSVAVARQGRLDVLLVGLSVELEQRLG